MAGLLTFVGVLTFAGGGSLLFTEVVGSTTNEILNPSKAGRKKEYSGPEALAARGLYQEAADAYEVAAAEEPLDPTPCVRLARLHRDRFADAPLALRWFRTARSRGLPPGEERVVLREMLEVAEKSDNPLQVAPDLARYAEEREGTTEGRWAEETLARLKERLRQADS